MSDMRRFYDIMLECGMLCPPYAQWEAAASDNAELWPIHKHGKMIGGVLFKGHTIHIAIHPDWQGRWLTPSLMRAYRTWTHTAAVVAHPPATNTRAIDLALRLGFSPQATQDGHQILVKEATCQQL